MKALMAAIFLLFCLMISIGNVSALPNTTTSSPVVVLPTSAPTTTSQPAASKVPSIQEMIRTYNEGREAITDMPLAQQGQAEEKLTQWYDSQVNLVFKIEGMEVQSVHVNDFNDKDFANAKVKPAYILVVSHPLPFSIEEVRKTGNAFVQGKIGCLDQELLKTLKKGDRITLKGRLQKLTTTKWTAFAYMNECTVAKE